jgi:colanic acid biosynthesis glycosyl transferase WcaI
LSAEPAGGRSRRPLRILLLIGQFPPDNNSAGLLMADLCRGLRDRGHQVSVLTSFPHYERFRVWKQYRGRLFERAREDGLEVLRLWVYASGQKQKMLHRLASYLSFCLGASLAMLLRGRRYDLVVCTNGSFFSGLAAAVGRFAYGRPFVYNVQDLYPEAPVAAGQLSPGRAVALLERLERWMYGAAAHVSVIAPSFRDNLLRKGVPPDKVSVIPNFVDADFIRPLPRDNAWSRAQGLNGRFVVCHAGSLGYVFDFETLLEAAALLRGQPELLFLIVGEGAAKPAAEARARALGLANVRFLPYQPREQLPWLRAAADVQLALYRPGAARYSLPSKVYEIMASGRALVASADADTDLRRLVEQTEAGLCLEPADPRALADALLALHRDPARRAALGANGRRAAEARFSRSAVVDQYERLLERLAGDGAVRPRPIRAALANRGAGRTGRATRP